MKSVSKCSKCGGGLQFSPSGQNLVCQKCQSTFELPIEKMQFHEIDMESVIKDSKVEMNSIRCMSCGAILNENKFNIARKCEYCGSHLVEDFGKELSVNPDGIIPFAFDKGVAKEKYLKAIKGKFFAPNNIKNGKTPYIVDSIYIPAYQFNCDTSSEYEGKLENRDEDSEGNTIYNSFRIRGVKDHIDKDVTIECSNYLTQMTLEKIKPFDMSTIKKFDSGFIMGYSVEHLNEKLSKVREMAKEINNKHIRSAILREYSYDRVSYLNVRTQYKSTYFAYIILPTYRISYTYKDKKYETFMNGQTGKLYHKYPKSAGKIVGLILSILAIVGLIYFIPIILKLLGLSA